MVAIRVGEETKSNGAKKMTQVLPRTAEKVELILQKQKTCIDLDGKNVAQPNQFHHKRFQKVFWESSSPAVAVQRVDH